MKSVKTSNLVKAVASAADTFAGAYYNAEITRLHTENEEIKLRISELENIIKNRKMTETDFDALELNLSVFANNFDSLTVEDKRNVFRMLIKSIVWDGENAQVFLLGDTSEPQCEDSK